MAESKSIPLRSQVPEADTWAIHDIFATDQLWWEALEKAKGYAGQAAAYRGTLGRDGATLLSYLKLGDEMSVAFDALINYAQRRGDEDTRVAEYQNMTAQLMALLVEVNQQSAFETPELLAISDETLAEFYRREPGLELYRTYLNRLRRRRHLLLEKNGVPPLFGTILVHAIIFISEDILHGHAADRGQLQRERDGGGIISPFDQADRLSGHPDKPSHLFLIHSQLISVFLQSVIQWHFSS